MVPAAFLLLFAGWADEPLPPLPPPPPGSAEPEAPIAVEPAPPAEAPAAPPPPDAPVASQRLGSAEKKRPCRPRERADACECKTKVEGGLCQPEPVVGAALFGVRLSNTHVAIGSRRSDEIGAALRGGMSLADRNGSVSADFDFLLGGGQAGFEGALGGALDFGVRADVTKEQGPFVRVGVEGRLQGNDAYYYSTLEIPRLTTGWQLVSELTDSMVELGGRGGLVLTGTTRIDLYERSSVGTPEVGFYARVQLPHVRLDGTLIRIFRPEGAGRDPVDLARVALCAGPKKVGVCLEALLVQTVFQVSGTPRTLREGSLANLGVTAGIFDW